MKFKISEKMFKTSVTFYIDNDSFFVETGVPIERKDTCDGLFHINTETFIISIWISVQQDTIKTISVLSHEITHLTHETARWIGISTSEDSEEFFAHYHQYYLERAIKKMKLIS